VSTIPGITTTTTSEVTDFAALGRFVADLGSIDQAEFLAGLAVGFQTFGDSPFMGLLQMEYVAEQVRSHNDHPAVRWLLRELDIRIGVEVTS